MNHAVDVLVPVHSGTRPISRLVESVLNENRQSVRIMFIAHDVASVEIERALGDWAEDERVEVVPFSDGVASPAGPLRHGLERIEAPFFCKIDSDDYLAPGAIDSWFGVHTASHADIVLPSMRLAGQLRNYPTPPTRPVRRKALDPVKDRLVYRTSTMGLIRTEYARHAAPSIGLTTGEDILPSLRLWFSGARIAAAPAEFCYVVGDDANDRVTAELRSISDELAFVSHLASDEVLSSLDVLSRASIVTKLLRVQIFGAVERRSDHEWMSDEIRDLSSLTGAVVALAPQGIDVLSRYDRNLLDVVLGGKEQSRASTSAQLQALGRDRRRYARLDALAPRELTKLMSRDAPLRFLAASVIAQRRIR